MTNEQEAKLSELGVNLDETLERFVGNENLYLKCLKTFVSNEDYPGLLSAIEEGNAKAAFDSAHSLKGVTANLGFTKLYEETKVITDVFRAGSMEYDRQNLERLKDEYGKVIRTIEEL